MSTQTVPLFPLGLVLYPEGPLQLRIFEPRYVDMVSRCMKNSEPFGVVMIVEGPEVQGRVVTQATGTLALIQDFYSEQDGLLGILARGQDRFRLLNMTRQDDGLNIGEIEVLPPEPEAPVPADFQPLARMLGAILEQVGEPYKAIPQRLDDASWVGYRFAEILPLSPEDKQYCLELDDPVMRLEFLAPFLRQLGEAQAG